MDATDTGKPAVAACLPLELGQIDRIGIAKRHLDDPALPVDIDSDLALEDVGNLEHALIELLGRKLPDGHGELIDGLEFIQYVGFDIC